MSLRLYQTMILCMFLSPITLQAYCNFERCKGYILSNLDHVPITMQEVSELHNFYTSVERDLLENLEILPDGTYKVTFSENVNVLLGMGVATRMAYNYRRFTPQPLKREIIPSEYYRMRQGSNNFLWDFFHDKPRTYMEIQGWRNYESLDSTISWHKSDTLGMRIYMQNPSGKYQILVNRVGLWNNLIHSNTRPDTTRVYFDHKIDGQWIRSNRHLFLNFDTFYDRNRKQEIIRTLTTLTDALQSDDPQIFENYLKARKISWTSAIVRNRLIRAGKLLGRHISRRTFGAILAGAGIIVGSQMLSEERLQETKLVISITKNQWENLIDDVRGMTTELSEHATLDELAH